jgi:hypothetical protein
MACAYRKKTGAAQPAPFYLQLAHNWRTTGAQLAQNAHI